MKSNFKNSNMSYTCCNNSCPNKFCNCPPCFFNTCVKKNSFIGSLYCVENFLCNYQKACNIYKIFCLFK